MPKYSTQSVIPQDEWEQIVSAFESLKSENKKIEFPEETIWKELPVGKYLERVRQLRAEHKLTRKEANKLTDDFGIDFQYNYRKGVSRHWYYMYGKAKKYYEREGTCDIRSTDDKELYFWVNYQKKCYRGAPRKRNNPNFVNIYPPLTEIQKQLLEEIEIVWTPYHKWNNYYNLLVDFYNVFHHTSVPSGTIIGRYYLGNWVGKIRRHKEELSEEQLRQLNDINFNWKFLNNVQTSFWEQATYWYFGTWFPEAENRKKLNGKELDIYSKAGSVAIEFDGVHWHKKKYDEDNEKDRFCRDNGIRLIRIREFGLPQTCYAKNYFLPKSFNARDFDNLLRDVFQREFGITLIDIDTRRDGLEILKNYKRIEDTAFYIHLEELKEYLKIHHKYPPSNKKSHAGLLGWIYNLRRVYIGEAYGVLTIEQIEELNKINFVWNPYEQRLNELYSHLQTYIDQDNDYLNSTYKDPTDNFALGRKIMVLRQRGPKGKRYRGSKLSDAWIKKFSDLGVNWTPGEPLLIPKSNKQEFHEGSLFEDL